MALSCATRADSAAAIWAEIPRDPLTLHTFLIPHLIGRLNPDHRLP